MKKLREADVKLAEDQAPGVVVPKTLILRDGAYIETMSLILTLMKPPGAPSNLVTAAGAGLVALMGLGVGEGISLAVNRKRGRRLKLVAGFSMFVGITVVTLVSGATFNTLILLASGLSFYIAVNKF